MPCKNMQSWQFYMVKCFYPDKFDVAAETAETLSGIDRDDIAAVEEFAEALNKETAPPIEVGEIEETT